MRRTLPDVVMLLSEIGRRLIAMSLGEQNFAMRSGHGWLVSSVSGQIYERRTNVLSDLVRRDTLAVRTSTLYLNPWSHTPAPNFSLAFPHKMLTTEKLVSVEGKSLAEFFTVAETWPE